MPALREKKTEVTPPKRKGKPLTGVSFFTGVGGLTLGFQNSGYQILASYDKKRIVASNVAINFPEMRHYQCDVSELTEGELAYQLGGTSVDVVFGGPPCQGFSIFGKRRFVNTKRHKIDSDDRNDLSFKFIDLATSISPRFILMENVKGMLSALRGKEKYIDVITRRLDEAGYEHEYRLINCADYGIPQLRERLILVAHAKGHVFKWPEPKFFASPKSWQRPYVTVGDVITDLMDPTGHCSELSHVPMNHKPLVVERYKLIPEGGRLPEGDLPKRLQAGYRSAKVKNFSHVYRRLSMSAPATTMVPGHNAFPVHPRLPRTLTVREAARIQTFPDSMRFIGSRQQQCLLVGNAVPPLLAALFAQSIAKSIRGNYADPGYKRDIYELRDRS